MSHPLKPRAVALGALALSTAANAGLIDPNLGDRLATAGPREVISTLVYLVDQADVEFMTAQLDAAGSHLSARHDEILAELRQIAAHTQPEVLAAIQALPAGSVKLAKPYWITNCIRLDATRAIIETIADRPDVEMVYLNYPIEGIHPAVIGAADAGGAVAGSVPEQGLVAIHAPDAWALGYDGSGVLVSNVDTGVDANHSSLASRWAGTGTNYIGHPEWAWLDPYAGQNNFPYDQNGHGTHTMGTICGGAPGDQIGVAPGATWIAAGAIDRGGGVAQTVADAIESFQWIVEPDLNPFTDWDVPAVCSNSWGVTTGHGYPPCDETFWAFLDNCEASGIVIVFAAGNESSSGLRRPSDRATDAYRTLSVAAVDGNNGSYPLASFSSLGPTNCTPNGASAIKPDIAAPGVDVRSAWPGGGYQFLSGTSMATPHIAGVVALIRDANPNLTVQQVKQIIYENVLDLGTPGEDNSYGHGLIDALGAVEQALSTISVTFTYPGGRPEFVNPNGGTILSVNVSGTNVQPVSDSGVLHLSVAGGPFNPYPMTEIATNRYQVEFPEFPCGSSLSYYVSVQTTQPGIALDPWNAPATFYTALGYAGIVETFVDNGEADIGWTVTNEALTDGPWDRGVPVGGGDRGDPADDFDGSGACYLTDNVDDNSDVDGGPTRLTSPIIDATGLADPRFTYARWFNCDDNDIDRMIVDISNNGGVNWVQVESVTTANSWVVRDLRIADFVAPTAQMRFRFSVTDNPNDSVTEGGMDAFRIYSFDCGDVHVAGDVDGDGDVDFPDVLAVLAAWGPCSACPEDLDGDGTVGFSDLLEVLANWS